MMEPLRQIPDKSRLRAFTAVFALLALLVPGAVAADLSPGWVLLLDQEHGYDMDTGEVWAGIYQVDPDTDTGEEAPEFLFTDREAFPRAQALVPLGGNLILVTDSFADPSGLGPDPNPENSDGDPTTDTGGHGAVWLIDLESNTVELVSDGVGLVGGLPVGSASAFVSPHDIMLLADGDILIADPDSDAAGFGEDPYGHAGWGALLRVNLASGSVRVVSDGSTYLTGPIPDQDLDGRPDPSIFVDPWAMATIPGDPDSVYVLDILSNPEADVNKIGAVFQVSLSTGAVTLTVSDEDFDWVNDIAWKEQLSGQPGSLLVIDNSSTDPLVPKVLIAAQDTALPWGAPDELETGLAIFTDEADNTYVIDSDADPWDLPGQIGPGALWKLDDSDPATLNVEVANSSNEYFRLVNGAPVPTAAPPQVDPLGLPPTCTGIRLELNLTGQDFDSDALLVTHEEMEVVNYSWVSANLITATVQVDCMAEGGAYEIWVFNPASRMADRTAVEVDPNFGDIGPPRSAPGDIDGDTIIDGLDLAEMGLGFGAAACCDADWNNDADLNDDGFVDGTDLGIFASSFGVRMAP